MPALRQLLPVRPTGYFGANGLADFITVPASLGGPDLKIWNQTSINDLQTYVPSLRLNYFPFSPNYILGLNPSGSSGP